MHLVTRRSRLNPIRSKTKQNALTLLAERSGRLLECISNGVPRGMTVRDRTRLIVRPVCPDYRKGRLKLIFVFQTTFCHRYSGLTKSGQGEATPYWLKLSHYNPFCPSCSRFTESPFQTTFPPSRPHDLRYNSPSLSIVFPSIKP